MFGMLSAPSLSMNFVSSVLTTSYSEAMHWAIFVERGVVGELAMRRPALSS